MGLFMIKIFSHVRQVAWGGCRNLTLFIKLKIANNRLSMIFSITNKKISHTKEKFNNNIIIQAAITTFTTHLC